MFRLLLDAKQGPDDHRPMIKEAAPPINPLEISREIGQAYHNRRIAAVNDHEVRMSVMTHAFPWHHHPIRTSPSTVSRAS